MTTRVDPEDLARLRRLANSLVDPGDAAAYGEAVKDGEALTRVLAALSGEGGDDEGRGKRGL